MKKIILFALALMLILPAASQTKTKLPAPRKTGGMPLMEALSKRATIRDMDPAKSLTEQQLSDLLWAAWGINRPDGRRTAPSAMNMQEIELYVIGRKGAYRYDAVDHSLVMLAEGDLRSQVNSQDYTKVSDFSVIFVADYAKMGSGDAQGKAVTAAVDAGFISQNIYLYCASEGLASVVHMTLNKSTISQILSLPATKQIVLGHTVGHPKK